MRERTIILPTRDNAGESLRAVHERVRRELLDIAGGYSQDRVTGAWRGNDGTVYHDASCRYTVLADADVDAAIAARVPAWCAWARQECVLTTAREVIADFIAAPAAAVA